MIFTSSIKIKITDRKNFRLQFNNFYVGLPIIFFGSLQLIDQCDFINYFVKETHMIAMPGDKDSVGRCFLKYNLLYFTGLYFLEHFCHFRKVLASKYSGNILIQYSRNFNKTLNYNFSEK